MSSIKWESYTTFIAYFGLGLQIPFFLLVTMEWEEFSRRVCDVGLGGNGFGMEDAFGVEVVRDEVGGIVGLGWEAIGEEPTRWLLEIRRGKLCVGEIESSGVGIWGVWGIRGEVGGGLEQEGGVCSWVSWIISSVGTKDSREPFSAKIVLIISSNGNEDS